MKCLLPWLAALSISVAARAEGDFAYRQGAFTLHHHAAFTVGVEGGQEELAPSITVGGAYYVDNCFALGAEITGYYFDQSVADDASGVALSLLLRHHFVDTGQYTIYFEASSGPAYTSREVPDGGTHFNFITRLGVGATVPVSDHADFTTGVRFFHLSNARLHGEDENPGMDGIQAYVGLIWRR